MPRGRKIIIDNNSAISRFPALTPMLIGLVINAALEKNILYLKTIFLICKLLLIFKKSISKALVLDCQKTKDIFLKFRQNFGVFFVVSFFPSFLLPFY